MWRSRITPLSLVALLVTTLLVGCGTPQEATNYSGQALSVGVAAVTTQQAFNPEVGAPLPYHRIIAAYGIVGGSPVNGPASTLDMLNAYLPQLQNLAKQYAALDPTHPTELAVDLVVNSIQPCSAFPRWCASFTDDATIQTYIQFCQRHNMLLFFDLQLGVEPVADAVTNYVQKYLQKYPFVELALDTEFHFPNTPQGYAEAAGYPCCLGWMDASEINWAINDLANISLQRQLPRKVLIIHQWNPAVITNKNKIAHNPYVSVVLQSDGFGYTPNKIGDYQAFVQSDMVGYGGYKLFYQYPGSTSYDTPLQSPADVMALFPQPLFISYQ
jgi:hypothetical protein